MSTRGTAARPALPLRLGQKIKKRRDRARRRRQDRDAIALFAHQLF